MATARINELKKKITPKYSKRELGDLIDHIGCMIEQKIEKEIADEMEGK